jgi:hypothetical protein
MPRVSGRSIGRGTGGSGSTGGTSGGTSGGTGGSTSGSSGSASSGGSSGSTSGSSGSASSGGGGRPSSPSVFRSPPPETVTVVPPSMEAPVKPERVDVHDPSTEMSFKPAGDIFAGVFGEPTEVTGVSTDPFRTINGELAFLQPEQEVVPEEQDFLPPEEEQVLPPATCPRNCNIIHIPTGIVSYEGMCSCSTIERYQQDPNYRVEFTTLEPEVPIVPEVIPEEEVTTDIIDPPGVVETSCYMVHGQQHELTQQAVDYYRNIGVTVTPCEEIEPVTVDVIPPEEPTPTPTPTPTTTPTGLANFGIAGILFAGVLALPILSGLGKWK